jgi:hypothetical protein
MNTTLMLIFELLGGVILLFAAGRALTHVIGYDEYYDKILYDDDDDFIARKNNNDSDEKNDIIHHVSI